MKDSKMPGREGGREDGPGRQLGRDGWAYFRELLGGPPDGWELEKASLTSRTVEFSLVQGPRRLQLALIPEPRRGPAGVPGFRLRSVAEDPGAEDRELAEKILRGLAEVNSVEMFARLRRDCLRYCDPDGDRAPSRLNRYHRVNDHSPDFWKFVYPLWRCLEQRVSLGAHWARISHSTLECRLSSPIIEAPALRFFADEPNFGGEEDCKSVETPFTAGDVLAGKTQEVLGRTLRETAEKEKPAYIHVNTTCLPELIGDSPMPFIRAIETETGTPVFWTSKTRPGGPIYAAWIERLLEGAKFSSRRGPRAVLLAGVPTPAVQVEAESLCAALGLKPIGSIFPNIDFRKVPKMGTASAVLWVDPVGWETIGDGPFLRRGLAVVRHHPPYGLAGTREWVRRVASVLGIENGEAAADGILKGGAAELEPIQAECRKKTVALIGDPADLDLLVVQKRSFGFSPAALLGELGFNIRCLVYAPGGKEQGQALRRPRADAAAGTIEFLPFSSKEELDRELAGSVDLAFSHFNHDPRLQAHALLGFTEAAFEPGVAGLARAGRRLLAKCAARPFPNHRSALTPWIK